MSDILDGRSPENIVYCKEEQQRQWLADVMGTEKFTVCPKKGAGRRPADALTTGRPDEVITPADATSFRVSLSTVIWTNQEDAVEYRGMFDFFEEV